MSENGRYIEIAGGKITETYTHDIEFFAGGSIITSAAKVISEKGEDKGVRYGEPKEYKPVNPNIVKVEFLDENNKVLKQETLAAFGNIQATNFFMGKKVKIKITTKDVADGTIIPFSLKGATKSTSQKFLDINKQVWNGTIKGNFFETPVFELDNSWFSEDFENYNYNTHKTEIATDDVNSFYVTGHLNARPFELPPPAERLKPVMYLRNYEELIGLFHTNDSGDKDLVDNYENKFIQSTTLESIQVNFSKFIYHTKGITTAQIKTRVEQDAKLLWETAVKMVQSGKLDDRPLYWTRLKMQAQLKQHYLFEKDIDFEKSIVNKNTELEKIIHLFEEKSRNYNGVDFSKAGSKKKILITGFDPFLLNSIKYPKRFNILQSNPSGVISLALANNIKLGAFIQTMVVPVRYSDFDGSQNHDNGQGEGIIEKYIKPFINQVDMIITVSQAGENDYNIDKFGTATRGGFNDNQDYIRVSGSHALITKDEWIETTLPKEFTNAPKVVYNWEFDNNPNPNKIKPIVGQKLMQGSGGDYLSNEIFYRVAKMRKENKPKLPTGHFHINKIQNPAIKEDLKPNEILEVLDTVKKGIEEGIKGI